MSTSARPATMPTPPPPPKLSVSSTAMGTVVIYATGGTIAGSGTSASQTAGYSYDGTISIQELMDRNPLLNKVANVTTEQICNVSSSDVTTQMLVRMSQQIQVDLAWPDVLGIVITHGTDTMDETAFFLDLTVKSHKVVALVGAMRPATAPSADGDMNLFQAVSLAASLEAIGRGVMIVNNDTIIPARYTTKTHANRIHTFAANHGCLGTFENGKPMFSYPASRPMGWRHFVISNLDPEKGLPAIYILYGHVDLPANLIAAAVHGGARGIVLSGTGAGCWTTSGGKKIEDVIQNKGEFPLIASYRTAFEFIGRDDKINGLDRRAIGGGFLNPSKCRIQLQLCLAKGMRLKDIKKVFE